MKYIIVFASVVLAVNAALDQELWLEFKKSFGREYSKVEEEQSRFAIFQQNMAIIKEHNEKYNNGTETYYLGVTEFADLSKEEFLSVLTLNTTSKPSLEDAILYEPSNVAGLPNEVNWVKRGAVGEVKNQKNCGSCWAFSTTGVLEGQYAIKHRSKISLSEQNLVDCSEKYGNHGCNGGSLENSYKYVHDHGIELEKDYRYEAHQSSCRFNSKLAKLSVKAYVIMPKKNENALQSAVAKAGPIAVAVDANLWQHYKGGIFDNSKCSQNVDHAVLVVGYGTDRSTKYWLIKNSWSTSWGEKGYIRMVRNKSNQCGIVNDATYPILN